MSEFRHRGLKVVVDTTEPAEMQIRGFQLSDRFMDRIARSFKAAPLQPTDEDFWPAMIRSIEGYDFLYVIGLQEGALVVTIGDVWLTEERPQMEKILQAVDFVAKLRRATGL